MAVQNSRLTQAVPDSVYQQQIAAWMTASVYGWELGGARYTSPGHIQSPLCVEMGVRLHIRRELANTG